MQRGTYHCGDVERLELAARIAAEAGRKVWFSPFTCDLTNEQMLDLLVDCAERAERLRQQGAEVVLVVGAEISLLNKGFLPGDTISERIELLADLRRLREVIAEVPARVNDFFGTATEALGTSPFPDTGGHMSSELEQFLAPYNPVVQELALELRALIRAVMPEAIEQFDAPAHLIGYGIDRTYKGLICGITLHTAHINLMFARGTELPDPEGLLAGSGKRARHVTIRQQADLLRPGVRRLLVAALQRHQEYRSHEIGDADAERENQSG